jgi:hypothetical protein
MQTHGDWIVPSVSQTYVRLARVYQLLCSESQLVLWCATAQQCMRDGVCVV